MFFCHLNVAFTHFVRIKQQFELFAHVQKRDFAMGEHTTLVTDYDAILEVNNDNTSLPNAWYAAHVFCHMLTPKDFNAMFLTG
jgi:hypothetical protein